MWRSITVILSAFILSVVLVPDSRGQSNPFAQKEIDKPLWTIKGLDPKNQEHTLIQECLTAGRSRIEKFFDKPFAKSFEVEVFPGRKQFDEYMAARWKIPKTQPWMVASGVGDKLTMLSRAVWKTQASEHKPDDDSHFRELIAHELVHVYHGQHNPTGDFEGMDDLGWLVEGLAVYVSGQLDHSHCDAAKDAIQKGKAPKTLAQAWSGRYRYGVCGSMMRYIDQTHGRETLRKLLIVIKPEQALKLLNTTEQEFLNAWTKHEESRWKKP